MKLAGWRNGVSCFTLSVSILALGGGCTMGDDASGPGSDEPSACAPGDSACTERSGGPNGSTPASAPAPTDGTKNGDETDVDCGGAGDARGAKTARAARPAATA